MKKKYGKKAQISGAAAAAWDGAWILAHAIKKAKSTGGSDVIAALTNATYSRPARRPRLQGEALRQPRDVSPVSYDGKSGKLVGKFSRIIPIPANPAC